MLTLSASPLHGLIARPHTGGHVTGPDAEGCGPYAASLG